MGYNSMNSRGEIAMRLLVVPVLIGLLVAPLAASYPPGDLPRPAPMPIPVPKDWQPGSYRGRVVALTDKTVTIKPEGNLRMEIVSFHPDGTVKEKLVYVQDNTQPPRVFTFSDRLLPRPNGQPGVAQGHKISDVRLGDVIYINCSQSRGVDHCSEIEIHRRPGGRVPPALQDERLSELGKRLGKDFNQSRLDTQMNAAQTAEEQAFGVIGWLGLHLVR
jgi:hypothetical protein